MLALGQRLAYEPGLEESLEILAELDLIAASARLAKDWRLELPTFDGDGALSLADARHPLIQNCVPNSLTLDAERRLLIVTGPNAGGKTVLLKTLGLAAVMSHSGLFVAAKKAHASPLRCASHRYRRRAEHRGESVHLRGAPQKPQGDCGAL